jgi:hypothetical protein
VGCVVCSFAGSVFSAGLEDDAGADIVVRGKCLGLDASARLGHAICLAHVFCASHSSQTSSLDSFHFHFIAAKQKILY